MMFLWALSAVPFGVYTIVQNFNIPLQIQPPVFCLLSLVCWAQTLVYNNNYAPWRAGLLAMAMGTIFGGIEVVLIMTFHSQHITDLAWPIMVIGISAAILLAVGLLPPYLELWKRKGKVVGISFVFLGLDWLGAFFSLMGVVSQDTFDLLGGCLYIVW